MERQKQASAHDLVDMELNCVMCGIRLYASISGAEATLASIERVGAAILICTCGQAHMIRRKPLKRND